MTKIVANSGLIMAKADELLNEYNTFVAAYDEMFKIVENVKSYWKDTNGIMYADNVLKYKDTFKAFGEHTLAIHKFLTNTAEAYKSAQENISKMIGQI